MLKATLALTVTILVLSISVEDSLSNANSCASEINVADFRAHVKGIGTENEDWQPAFQKAIEIALQTTRAVYVPTGVYKIRNPITVTVPKGEINSFGDGSIRIFGDGPFHSKIHQQVQNKNCIDWSGNKSHASMNGGQLSNICLSGGLITLNIRWHNYFKMDSCYILGAKKYGVFSEGWSSRFTNSSVRWCREAGIYGAAHFNNVVIRDCYFSRNGIGFCLKGGHGVRVEGSGFERCARAAIYLANAKSFTVSNSYFEGNGYKDSGHFIFEGSANTVHIDRNCHQITIHDNILRVNLDKEGALISISECLGGHIYDNLFYSSKAHRANNAIKLRNKCEVRPGREPVILKLIEEHNIAINVTNLLVEQIPGLVDKAISRESSFEWIVNK